LKIIGQIIALGAAYGLVVQPFVKLYQFFKVPGRLGKVKRLRMYATLFALAGIIVGICLIPFPSHVYCPLEVQARNAAFVYAAVDGILESVEVEPGDEVKEGQLLAQLDNIDVDIAIADLIGQSEVYSAELLGLQRISVDFPDERRASAEIGPVSEGLARVKKQLVQREDDREKLKLVAPRAGTVLPPPLIDKQGDESAHLSPWHGSPLDPENRGALLVAGTKLCQIGDPNKLEARLMIDQGDVAFVEPGQDVKIMLDQSAEYVYISKIERRATETLKMTPKNLSSLQGGPLPTQMDPGGVARPLSPVFEAVVPLPEQDPHGLLRIGLVGRAKISTAPRTLWDRLVRYASRTFNFEL
jgi:putative peptide zinc metalloprotease protein